MNIDDVLRSHGVGVGKKLKGDVTAGDVRAGKTFSNALGNANVGTLVVQSTVSQSITPGTANIVKGAGIYDGAITVNGDTDLIASNIKSGVNIFGVVGSFTNEGSVPITAATVLSGKKGYVNGALVTGTMVDRGTVTITPSASDQTIAVGYHNGLGKVLGDADLIASNIKSGVDIFGVVGSFTDEAVAPITATTVLSGKKGYVNGVLVTGTMVDRGGAVTVTPGTASVVKAAGYYSGAITVEGDTDLVAGNIRSGISIFGIAGDANVINTSEATVPITAATVLSGKKGYVNGALVTGTMVDRGGAVTVTPGIADVVKSAGYYSGAITIAGDADLVSANIKSGVSIFGVAGNVNVIDTAEVTNPATTSQIRSGKIAFVNGAELTGTLAVQATGTQNITPTTVDIIKPAGIYDGAITVLGDTDLIPSNIKSGTNIFNVVGTVVEATGDAIVDNVLAGKVFSKDGAAGLTGTMPNRSGITVSNGSSANIPEPDPLEFSSNGSGYYGMFKTRMPHSGYYDETTIFKSICYGLNPAVVKAGQYIGPSGSSIVGTFTADADAVAANILAGKTAYVNGALVTGSMIARGVVTAAAYDSIGTMVRMRPPIGYYDGTSASLVTVVDPDFVAENIVSGKQIFSLTGTAPKISNKLTSGPFASQWLASSIHTIRATTGNEYEMKMSANGRYVLMVASNGSNFNLEVFDTTLNQIVCTIYLAVSIALLRGTGICNDGTFCVAHNTTVNVYDITGAVTYISTGYSSDIIACSMSPDGSYIATMPDDVYVNPNYTFYPKIYQRVSGRIYTLLYTLTSQWTGSPDRGSIVVLNNGRSAFMINSYMHNMSTTGAVSSGLVDNQLYTADLVVADLNTNVAFFAGDNGSPHKIAAIGGTSYAPIWIITMTGAATLVRHLSVDGDYLWAICNPPGLSGATLKKINKSTGAIVSEEFLPSIFSATPGVQHMGNGEFMTIGYQTSSYWYTQVMQKLS